MPRQDPKKPMDPVFFLCFLAFGGIRVQFLVKPHDETATKTHESMKVQVALSEISTWRGYGRSRLCQSEGQLGCGKLQHNSRLSKNTVLASSLLARSEARGKSSLKKEVKKDLKLFANVVTSTTFIVNQLTRGEGYFGF